MVSSITRDIPQLHCLQRPSPRGQILPCKGHITTVLKLSLNQHKPSHRGTDPSWPTRHRQWSRSLQQDALGWVSQGVHLLLCSNIWSRMRSTAHPCIPSRLQKQLVAVRKNVFFSGLYLHRTMINKFLNNHLISPWAEITIFAQPRSKAATQASTAHHSAAWGRTII